MVAGRPFSRKDDFKIWRGLCSGFRTEIGILGVWIKAMSFEMSLVILARTDRQWCEEF